MLNELSDDQLKALRDTWERIKNRDNETWDENDSIHYAQVINELHRRGLDDDQSADGQPETVNMPQASDDDINAIVDLLASRGIYQLYKMHWRTINSRLLERYSRGTDDNE